MIEFENQVIIRRPVDTVFGFVSDFSNVPKWNYYVRSVARTAGGAGDDGPTGVGAAYHQVRKTDAQDFAVTEYEPGRRVTVETLPGSRPAFEMRFTFAEEGGATRLTEEWQLDTGRFPPLEWVMTGRVRAAALENLRKLKHLLEMGVVQLQDGRRVRL